jgi:hypothetical protein
MQNCEPEKESHLIEAIVFTTDFLSCYKEPIRSSNWIFGSDSTEMLDTNDYLLRSDESKIIHKNPGITTCAHIFWDFFFRAENLAHQS